jgi:folate-dependent phosphoribosylglycinamide formyltransferase PurN
MMMELKKILLVGHDNYGSREIFTKIVDSHPDIDFSLFITQGIYHKRSFISSVIKLLREASWAFCFIRYLEMLAYRFRNDTLKRRAARRKVPTFFIKDINSPETRRLMDDIAPDLMMSMFTMHVYKKETLNLPKHGSVGTHPSILPHYRGLEVFFWALANEETESGVSVLFLSNVIDEGKVFLQERFAIERTETVSSIYRKLTTITARLMSRAITVLQEGSVEFLPSEGTGSYYPMPTSEAYKRFRKTTHRWFGK